MFKPFKDTSFYLCQYNFNHQRWEWIKKFKNEEELITYLASCFHYKYYFWDAEGKPYKPQLVNSIEHRFNYTGKDTGSDFNHGNYFRDIMIIDADNRIIDPRRYLDNATAKFHERTRSKRSCWYVPCLKNHRYRKDPVPYTGCHHGSLGRRVKTWFRSYRQDRIPEYEPYIRKKARVPNTWDSEPFHHFEKSWKHQTKYRHQWEKNLNKKDNNIWTKKEQKFY